MKSPRSRPRNVARWCAGFFLLAGACADPDGEERPLPEPSYEVFARDVYPVMLRDCGFVACHAQSDRFLQIYGPGRARLSPMTMPYEPPTAEEVRHSYDRARSFLLDRAGEHGYPLLLRKPLAESLGGARHRGDDAWGQPIFERLDDPRFQVLAAWALGESPKGAP